MFGLGVAVASVVMQIELAKAEEAAFQKSVEALPEDQRPEFIRHYRKAQEKRRLEAVAERRHQELLQAIRDSRPRGIGIFL